jgi:hypothetical protein
MWVADDALRYKKLSNNNAQHNVWGAFMADRNRLNKIRNQGVLPNLHCAICTVLYHVKPMVADAQPPANHFEIVAPPVEWWNLMRRAEKGNPNSALKMAESATVTMLRKNTNVADGDNDSIICRQLISGVDVRGYTVSMTAIWREVL